MFNFICVALRSTRAGLSEFHLPNANGDRSNNKFRKETRSLGLLRLLNLKFARNNRVYELA